MIKIQDHFNFDSRNMGPMNANLFLKIHFIQIFYEDTFFLCYSSVKKNYNKNIERKYQISHASKSQNITIPRMKNIFIRSIKFYSSYHRLSVVCKIFVFLYIYIVKMIGSFNGLAQGNNIA